MSEPSNSSPVSGAAQPTSGAGATPGTSNVGADPKPEIQFNSSAIGTITARHEDPFKEHKARAAEKKAKNDKIRKRVLITLGVILLLALLGVGVWWVISMLSRQPEPEENFWQTEEAQEIQSTAQEVYKGDDSDTPGGNDSEVEEYFNEQLNNTDGQKRVDIILSEMIFYSNNARSDLTIKAAEKVPDPESLDDNDLRTYCGYVYNAAQSTGQGESLLDKCDELLSKLPVIIEDGEG